LYPLECFPGQWFDRKRLPGTEVELKTVFITGATGFVGSHTARLFLTEGWRVRALVRRPDRPGLLPEGVEVVAGGLSDVYQYRGALAGSDVVLHVAGLVKALTLADYRQANTHGTEALARAAAEACPAARFVLVSSQAAAGPARDGRPVTESDPPKPVSWYGMSKLEGEQALQRSFPGSWCIIRPTIVYGSGDPGLLELFAVIQGGWALLPAGGRMRVQLLAVQDLARILFATANRTDVSARVAFAAGPTASTCEWLTEIASLRNPPARVVSLPGWVVRLFGTLESGRQWVTGRVRPFNRDKAREALQPDWLCDAEPLLHDLGISELAPWKQGIREVCRCYVAAGWLRPSVWSV
jgi:nucleoside-diphosphate-sugar epimerase